MQQIQKDKIEMAYKQAQIDLIEQIEKSVSQSMDYSDIMRLLIIWKNVEKEQVEKIVKRYQN
jgi:hypothetical protein